MKVLWIVLSSLFVPSVWAQSGSYHVHKPEGQVVVTPSTGTFGMNFTKAPACTDLYAELEQRRDFIDLCLENDEGPSSCLALKRSLYHLVWEQKETAAGLSQPVVYPASLRRVTIRTVPITRALARAIGEPIDNIVAATHHAHGEVKIEDYEVRPAVRSWLALIAKLKTDKDVTAVEMDDEGRLVLGNRLLACELDQQQADLQVTTSAPYQFKGLFSLEGARSYWQLYRTLEDKVSEYAHLPSLERALRLGVAVGSHAKEHAEVDIEVAIEKLFKFSFYSGLQLQSYRRMQDLRAVLPSQTQDLVSPINLIYHKE